MSISVVGQAVSRRDGRQKVTGEARYIDDLRFPGMLHGTTVRSAVPRARIMAIRFGPTIPWREFTVVTAGDIPGCNRIAAILDDQPCLAEGVINHPEEPVVLLAHADPCLLENARRAVELEVKPLPAVFTIEQSQSREEIVWGRDNILHQLCIEKGDLEQAWKEADLIVQGEYSTGAQEQLYIEPNGMIAVPSEEGITVWGSMQCPFYVHKALTAVLGLKDDQVRVIQTETGGGFGGKEDYPSIIACHAALLAWKSRRPVKLIYSRGEDMVATTKRHPSRIHHKTAVSRDGKIIGMDIDLTIDGGAYATLSPVVLSRAAIHATGPYCCPNVRIRGQAVATNTPPHGAFRGFGAPQSLFAMERHMDKVAAALGTAPEELRRRNFLRKGEITATGQQIREDVNLAGLLDLALTHADYHRKSARFAAENVNTTVKRGIGLAAFFHGAGFTGSGERYLASIAGVEATPDGTVRVLASSTEFGQGTNTILAQIVAEALKLPIEQIVVVQPDTACVPNSGPTVASRTCMIVGKLLERAALELLQRLQSDGRLGSTYSPEEFRRACAGYFREHDSLKSYAHYEAPPGVHWDDRSYKGDAYGTFAWAVYVAEVSVDILTFEIKVEDFVAVQEVGKVIHPILAAGQIEGGVVQAIGYALYENVVWQEGRMANSRMTDYHIPTAADVPPIRVFFVEDAYAHGPLGAKGIGELPMDGPAPAILNAIENAVGVSLTSIPATPEVLMQAMKEAREQDEEEAAYVEHAPTA